MSVPLFSLGCWTDEHREPGQQQKMSSDFEIANAAGPSSAATAAAGLNHQWSVVTDHSSAAETAEHRGGGGNRRRSQRCCCARCWTAGCTWLTSAVGVSLLLLVYLMTGAIMFMMLGNQEAVQAERSSANHHEADGRLLEKTMATVDRLWSITEDLNILYRDNWTHLARVEMRHYQDQIVRTLRHIMLEERYSVRQTWTFPMSLLYALTLITTIGTSNSLSLIQQFHLPVGCVSIIGRASSGRRPLKTVEA